MFLTALNRFWEPVAVCISYDRIGRCHGRGHRAESKLMMGNALVGNQWPGECIGLSATRDGHVGTKDWRSGRHRHLVRSERLRETGFQKFPEFGGRLKLRNGFQFLECRCERVRQAPDRPRLEFLVLRFEVLCCRQHKRTYVAERFMWRPPRGCA